MQDQEQAKIRVKLDGQGRYAVNVGLFTGNSFTAGWNNTGIGAGENAYKLSVKQLFVEAQPVKGLDAQVGSLYFWRGEGTEITTFDNDGYLTGERVSLRRADRLFFDEIAFTSAYVGDTTTPNVFRRADRLGDANYRQFALAKRLGPRGAASIDYTVLTGSETLRAAGRVTMSELRVVDALRLEGYRRVNRSAAGGFAITGEKTIARSHTLALGYATIDPRFGALNGERYGIGRHLFATGTFAVSRTFSVGAFAARGIGNEFRVPIGTRVEIIGTFNLAKAFQRMR